MLLELREIKKYFPVTKGIVLMKVTGWVKAVDGVSCSIANGETLGLVGESGCGKTTTAKMVLLLEKPTSGSIIFEGKDIQHLTQEELKHYRSRVQAVFQDPYCSLSPRMRIRDIISEPIAINKNLPRHEIKQRVGELLEIVGLRPATGGLYPHELSGGQRQRVALARSLSSDPGLIILDEPVSALDVSIRAQLMNLLRDLQAKLGVSYLLIAHDLAVVKQMSTRVGVMYLGKLVEYAPTQDLYNHNFHPYTKALLSAALPFHPDIEPKDQIILAGEVPSPLNPPSGCHFHPRCPCVMPICSEVEPRFDKAETDHYVACHLFSQP